MSSVGGATRMSMSLLTVTSRGGACEKVVGTRADEEQQVGRGQGGSTGAESAALEVEGGLSEVRWTAQKVCPQWRVRGARRRAGGSHSGQCSRGRSALGCMRASRDGADGGGEERAKGGRAVDVGCAWRGTGTDRGTRWDDGRSGLGTGRREGCVLGRRWSPSARFAASPSASCLSSHRSDPSLRLSPLLALPFPPPSPPAPPASGPPRSLSDTLSVISKNKGGAASARRNGGWRARQGGAWTDGGERSCSSPIVVPQSTLPATCSVARSRSGSAP